VDNDEPLVYVAKSDLVELMGVLIEQIGTVEELEDILRVLQHRKEQISE
jgi:hypothetical protein